MTATGVPLGTLLRDIAAAARIDKLFMDPEAEKKVVTVELRRVKLKEAILQILADAAIPFAFWGNDEPQSMRVFAGDRKFVENAYARSADNGAAPTKEAGVDEVAGRRDEKEPEISPEQEAAQAQALEALKVALAPQPRTPGALVALPFPGPDGAPLTGTLPVPDQPKVLPFPGPDGSPMVAPAAPRASASPPPSDPALRALIEALAPRQPKEQ